MRNFRFLSEFRLFQVCLVDKFVCVFLQIKSKNLWSTSLALRIMFKEAPWNLYLQGIWIPVLDFLSLMILQGCLKKGQKASASLSCRILLNTDMSGDWSTLIDTTCSLLKSWNIVWVWFLIRMSSYIHVLCLSALMFMTIWGLNIDPWGTLANEKYITYL